jgi:hypothetical protein
MKSFPATGAHLIRVFISCVTFVGTFFVCFLSNCFPLPCSFPLEDHLYGFIMMLITYAELLFLLVAALCVVDWWCIAVW